MIAISHKGYTATVEFDPEDELFIGRLAGLNDVVGFHADNVPELRAAFHEAVDDYIAACEKAGKAPERPYSGRIMVRIAPEIHQRAALAAQLSGKSLNQWTEDALREAAERTVKAVPSL